jgi:undecaprenyl-diphosphatase
MSQKSSHKKKRAAAQQNAIPPIRPRKGYLIASAVLLLLFCLLIVILKTVDVFPIGPEGSEIGLSAMNGLVLNQLGAHPFWYNLTELFGFLALAVMLYFGIVGLLQLIKRKHLRKVDTDLFLLAGSYCIVLFFYVLFEILIINYRPVLVDGVLEAAFPSSHTMLVLSVLGTAIPQIRRRISAPLPRVLLIVGCAVLMATTVFGRLLSGVHWSTDILGGILLSGAIVCCYVAFLPKKNQG